MLFYEKINVLGFKFSFFHVVQNFDGFSNEVDKSQVTTAGESRREENVFPTTKNRSIKSSTAPFNNMPILKFKAQSTNAFFATVNQMFGGSSQLSTILSSCLNCAQRFDFITARSTIVGSLKEPLA